MNISLTPQLENFVKQKVEEGMYNTVSEALQLLIEREVADEMKRITLRHELQEGIDSLDRGKGSPLDMNDIKARAIKASQAGV